MKRLALVWAALSAAALGGCGSSDQPAVIESTAAAFNSSGAPTVEFSVPDMMCEVSCCPTVRKTLAAQPGVKDVKVELATKTATVAVDKDKFDANAAIAALVDLQFKNTTLKSEGASTGGEKSAIAPAKEPNLSADPEKKG